MNEVPYNEKIYGRNVAICMKCDHRAGKCPIDGDSIIDHANGGYCPIGLYRLGIGDWLARLFHRTGVKAVVQKATGGNCGCKKRQLAWNGQPQV